MPPRTRYDFTLLSETKPPRRVQRCTSAGRFTIFMAIPHNSKCRYGERGAADAKPKAQIILDAAKVSAASGGNSEPKQGQRSQSARGFCPRSTMRVPQPDIIEHFGNADAVPQPPEQCLSRKAGIVRCCLIILPYSMAGTWVSTCGAPPASSSAVTGAGSTLVVRRSLATASISLMRFSWLTRVALGS